MARLARWHLPRIMAAVLVVVAALSHAHDRAHDTGAGLIGNLLNALHMMRNSPEWMSNRDACAKAVDKTLNQLADEYLDTYVSFTLTTACEHMNVYKDFGGTEQACRPVFVDLGDRFDGKKDYAGWCESTASFIDGGASQGGGGGTPAKAVATSAGDGDAAVTTQTTNAATPQEELDRIENKRARGEDVHQDLKNLRSRVEDLERHQAVQVAEANSRAQPQQADMRVSDSEWGQKAPPAPVDDGSPMPFRARMEHAPFGQEHKGRTYTDASVRETNDMVDQIERAQAAEEKRAAYRALTHLRSTATSSFDGIANQHLQNIHEYNAKNRWRATHPVRHLAEEEGDVETWGFPHAG